MVQHGSTPHTQHRFISMVFLPHLPSLRCFNHIKNPTNRPRFPVVSQKKLTACSIHAKIHQLQKFFSSWNWWVRAPLIRWKTTNSGKLPLVFQKICPKNSLNADWVHPLPWAGSSTLVKKRGWRNLKNLQPRKFRNPAAPCLKPTCSSINWWIPLAHRITIGRSTSQPELPSHMVFSDKKLSMNPF